MKRLQTNKFRKSTQKNTIIRSFPGRANKDRLYYLKLAIRKSLSFIHVHTSELRNDSAAFISNKKNNNIRPNYVDLFQYDETFFDFALRRDVQNNDEEVTEVNKRLNNQCKSRDWTLIDSMIDKRGLDRFALHVNKTDSAILARNMIKWTKRFQH